MKSFLLISLALASASALAAAPKVSIVSPADGAVVSSPVQVKMAIKGMKLRPAGEDLKDQTTGHFHLLVDKAPLEKGQVIPSDASSLHYGKAQEEATLTLTPGTHTLTLLLGDGAHRSFGKELSHTVKITVK